MTKRQDGEDSARTDPIASSIWGRGPKPDAEARKGLGLEQILANAMSLLDSDGIDGLSMRRLGAALGAGATSLYWHVANKEELIDLVLDEALGEVQLPAADSGGTVDWQAALRGYATSLRDTLVRHSWVLTVIGGRANVGPKATAMSEALLGVLLAAGFTIEQSGNAGSGLASYVFGAALAEASTSSAMKRSGMTSAQLATAITQYYEDQPGIYPNLTRWMQQAKLIDLDALRIESFEFGLECYLHGLAHVLSTP